jgi:hypothetical protein
MAKAAAAADTLPRAQDHMDEPPCDRYGSISSVIAGLPDATESVYPVLPPPSAPPATAEMVPYSTLQAHLPSPVASPHVRAPAANDPPPPYAPVEPRVVVVQQQPPAPQQPAGARRKRRSGESTVADSARAPKRIDELLTALGGPLTPVSEVSAHGLTETVIGLLPGQGAAQKGSADAEGDDGESGGEGGGGGARVVVHDSALDHVPAVAYVARAASVATWSRVLLFSGIAVAAVGLATLGATIGELQAEADQRSDAAVVFSAATCILAFAATICAIVARACVQERDLVNLQAVIAGRVVSCGSGFVTGLIALLAALSRAGAMPWFVLAHVLLVVPVMAIATALETLTFYLPGVGKQCIDRIIECDAPSASEAPQRPLSLPAFDVTLTPARVIDV